MPMQCGGFAHERQGGHVMTRFSEPWSKLS